MGDRAKWVRAAATGCSSEFDVTRSSPVVASTTGGLTARFSVGRSAAGPLTLCYKFRYQQQSEPGRVPATPFVLFPAIRAAAVAFDDVAPRGTALGCVSNLTIHGVGFLSLAPASHALRPSEAPQLTCTFGALGSSSAAPGITPALGSTSATIVSDTLLTCKTIAPTAESLPLRVELGSYTSALPTAFPAFAAYDGAALHISAIHPPGGTYNLERRLTLRGSFSSFGTPLCRFGSLGVGTVNITNASYATCVQPRFPDSLRDAVGPIAVTFSANGQCFIQSPTKQSSFQVYNSQLSAIRVAGAPMTSPASLGLLGEGFVVPALPGAVCRFVPIDDPSSSATGRAPVTTTLTALSSTLVRCASPASGQAGAWRVQVLQNSVEPALTMGEDPVFSEYDPTTLELRQLVPPGAPVNGSAAMAIYGDGFARYGEGQLVCIASDGRRADATLLDSKRLLCTLPAASSAGKAFITVSLNNGTEASTSMGNLAFETYFPPRVTSITPTAGNAEGGTLATLTGAGFAALSSDHSMRISYLRVRFGSQKVAVLDYSDTSITCVTPWGPEGAQPVQVGLDGVNFGRPGEPSPPTYIHGC